MASKRTSTKKRASTKKRPAKKAAAKKDRPYGDRAKTKATTKKKRQPESKTSARRLAAAKKRREAVELRLKGYSYSEIARAVGFAGEGAARKTVEVALRDSQETTNETAAEVRALELGRLDKMFSGLYPAAEVGDPRSVEAALKIQARRAKLLGIDAPQRMEHSGPNGEPIKTTTVTGPDVKKMTPDELARWVELNHQVSEFVERFEARMADP